MTLDALTPIVSVLAIVASLVSVYVVLYVKAALGPIITQLANHQRTLEQGHDEHVDLYKQLRHHGERLARLESRDGNKRTITDQ